VKAHHGKLLRKPVALYACIDIGSNTTRLLVAEPGEDGLREIVGQRAFTRIGRGLKRDAPIPMAKFDEVAEVVATHRRLTEVMGVERLRAVATAVIRRAPNGPELCRMVRERTGVEVEVLDGEEEARLAFVGATRTLGHPVDGEVAVADVGGGSSELALGTVEGGVRWSASFRVGSGFLADAYLRSDPPSIDELHAVREHAAGAFEGVETGPPALAVAVGGSATSLRRLVGARLEHETLERGVRVLATTPIAEVARRFELEPERVRLLPAGILILEAISDRLGCPLQVGRGGLREGVILEMAAANGTAA
jgi:exopolyphosphatase/guanosine-5'-triphosphate,3'-diphosphate pyrophosphatase